MSRPVVFGMSWTRRGGRRSGRALGEGPVLDLAYELEDSGELENLLAMDVSQALAAVWPRLRPLVPVTEV